MSDSISRQATIDVIFSELLYESGMKKRDADAVVLAIYEKIKSLPPAQPEQRWVSCSKRMPEEREWIGTKRFGTTISDEVYVTFERPDGGRFVKHICFQNGKLSNHDQLTIDAFHKGAIPIAWMPLPEPYAERRTDE